MSIRPVTTKERVQLLDILRGFAILGMWTVNMTVDAPWGDEVRESQLSLLDLVSLVFIDLFTSGKFFTIFSFLFGVGFFVQIERVRARQSHHVAFYFRRSAGLLFISILALACQVHTWILINYAIFGLVLLLFYDRSFKAILAAAVFCFVLSTLFDTILPAHREGLERAAAAAADEPAAPAPDPALAADPPDVPQLSGSHLTALRERSLRILRATWTQFSNWNHYVKRTDILGMLLIGLYVARRGAVWDRDIRRKMARRALPWLMGIGLVGGLVRVAIEVLGVGGGTITAAQPIFGAALWPVWWNVLGLGYVAGITLLVERDSWRRRLAPCAAVGRTALTNYLFTGAVGSVIIYGWQFGWHGPVTPAIGLLIVFAFFPLQVMVSAWWLSRHRFGPVEWFWRFLTYGSRGASGNAA